MNKNLILVGLFASSAFASSCSNSQKSAGVEEEIMVVEKPIYTADNSATSLDWNGTYEGTVPCASCEGIETMLTLNIDRTYRLVTNYLGRNDALEEENTGSFTWDEVGSIITLKKVAQGPTQYQVGENRIWQLDLSGNRIAGDLADHYILTKQ